jgi:hypothetical protein
METRRSHIHLNFGLLLPNAWMHCLCTDIPLTSSRYSTWASLIPTQCTCPAPVHLSFVVRWDRHAFRHLGPHDANPNDVWEISGHCQYLRHSLNRYVPIVRTRTFVPLHPNLNATSFATSSPKPSISPLTNGNNKFMAAPRRRPQSVGGL